MSTMHQNAQHPPPPTETAPDYAALSINSAQPLYAIRLTHDELCAMHSDPTLDVGAFLARAQTIVPPSEDGIPTLPDAVFFLRSPSDLRAVVRSHIVRMNAQIESQSAAEKIDERVDRKDDTEEEELSRLPNTPPEEEETDVGEAAPASSCDVLANLHKDRPSEIVFTLDNLPEFNVTKILCGLSVTERLVKMTVVSKRFLRLVYQPQCFGDVSFFPLVGDREAEDFNPDLQPRILNVHGSSGITYVQVCLLCRHPFIQKVAKYAGMWNFKAELWNQIDWPKDLAIESLQLSFDPNSNITCLDLDEGLPPTTRLRLTNLFFIKADTNWPEPQIKIPPMLQGIGVQGFGATAFSSVWWNEQIFDMRRLESVRFLVLSCCNFSHGELQALISKRGCPSLEHLSLRYVKWEGCIDLPQSLVSLGWFPDKGTDNFFRLPIDNQIWQLQTRLSENIPATIEMLNRMHDFCPHLHRISFEYIRTDEPWHSTRVETNMFKKWEHEKRGQNLTVVVDPVQWGHQPKLSEVFELREDQFLTPAQTHFLDCPMWSDDGRDFIRMTSRRKLLLR